MEPYLENHPLYMDNILGLLASNKVSLTAIMVYNRFKLV